jgi:hypothetical protein
VVATNKHNNANTGKQNFALDLQRDIFEIMMRSIFTFLSYIRTYAILNQVFMLQNQ